MKKKFKMPTAFTVLFIFTIAIAVLTWVVPAGQYQYIDPNAAKPEPIPGTYSRAEQNPQGIWDVLYAPIKGFFEGSDIILFCLFIGGFLAVVIKTGAIDAGIKRIVKKLEGREQLMIPVLMIIFGIGGTVEGMSEETIAFYMLIIPVFIAAGYDAITGLAVIFLGSGIGYTASTLNPFAIGIASGFAGISVGDGFTLRFFLFIACEAIGIIFVLRYAKKVKKDPSKSLIYNMKEENEKFFLSAKKEEIVELTKKRKVILWVFGLTFVIMVIGVIPWAGKFNINFFQNFNDALLNIPFIGKLCGHIVTLGDWWFGEMTLLFFFSSVIIARIYGMGEEEFIETFIAGAKDLLAVSLVIGVSRGIGVVMNDGGMTATVLHWGEQSLKNVSSVAFTILSFFFYIPMSFLVPSSSGLATLTMPIMAPLADFANVDRNIIVTSYATASGMLNLFAPTNGVLMGALALAKVPFQTYIKYVWKLLVVLTAVILVSMCIAVLI